MVEDSSSLEYDSLVHEAFDRLWPTREFDYSVKEEFNRRLGDFNANISLRGRSLTMKYNLKWKNVDHEIRIGLVQHLLLKMFARKSEDKKKSTFNIKLYNNFCKQIPTYVIDDHDLEANCDVLRESFNRVNERFFEGDLSECSLNWGSPAVRRLASYNFNNDSITVSSIFRESPSHVLDLLMYHEMLHKDLKFNCKNGRVHTHTPEFKRKERLYPEFDKVEKEIERIIQLNRRNGSLKQKRSNGTRNSILKKLQDFWG